MDKQKGIIFDLDGTLVDTRPAQHYVTHKPKNFKAFHEYGVYYAEPNAWVMTHLFRWISRGVVPILLSGRQGSEKGWGPQTAAWLDRYGVPRSELHMRDYGDNRPDDVIKEEIYRRSIEPYYDVRWAYDDRPRVIRMWRDKVGLHVLDVGTWPIGITD